MNVEWTAHMCMSYNLIPMTIFYFDRFNLVIKQCTKTLSWICGGQGTHYIGIGLFKIEKLKICYLEVIFDGIPLVLDTN